MNRTRMGLLLLVSVAGLAFPLTRSVSQQNGPDPFITAELSGKLDAASFGGERLTRMYEDVEVFRRLLADTVLKAPGAFVSGPRDIPLSEALTSTALPARGTSGMSVMMSGMMGAGSAVGPHHPHGELGAATEAVEGVYLKGYGVVFTMTLPVHYLPVLPQKAAAEPAPKPPSQWDLVRRELRGEKIERTQPKAKEPQATLFDLVVKTLAENGHHFDQLADQERLTVSVTLRSSDCYSCHSSPLNGAGAPGRPIKIGPGAAMGPGGMGNGIGPGGPMGPSSSSGTVGTGGGPTPSTSGGPVGLNADVGLSGGITLNERNFETEQVQANNFFQLGDLRLKQGRAQEAVESYQKAFGILHKVWEEKPNRREVWEGMVETSGQLAKALVKLGKNDEALKWLKTSEMLLGKEWGTGKTAARTDEGKATGHLPARLTVSAPIGLLRGVGSGKATLEEFKKSVSLEYLTFDRDAGKGGGGPGKP